jgi:hypothetical protein
MKKFLMAAAALGALALATPASAQNWQGINQRQANLEQRIDTGVRNGSLTRTEAQRLRTDFRGLAQLEARYRSSNGLSANERRDLDQRFDALSARIRVERHDNNNNSNWQSINQRQRTLDNRIDAGVNSGRLTRNEAAQLRAEFRQIASLEANYRRNGLNNQERRELDRRFDRLSAELTAQLNDRQRRHG